MDNNKLEYPTFSLHELIDAETRDYIENLHHSYQEQIGDLSADIGSKTKDIERLTSRITELEAEQEVSNYLDKAEKLSQSVGSVDVKYAVLVVEEKEGRYGDYGTETHRSSECYLYESYTEAVAKVAEVEASKERFYAELERYEIPDKCKKLTILIPYTTALGLNLDKMTDAFSYYEG